MRTWMGKWQVRHLCVVLSNKRRLDCVVKVCATGRQVLDHVTLMCGVRSLKLFGLAVFIENEYLFVELDKKLGRYFGEEWRRTSRTAPILLFLRVQHYVETVQQIEGCVQQELYFSDLRRKVLDSRCDHQQGLFFELAATALQAEMGDAMEHIMEGAYEEDGKENPNITGKNQNQSHFLPEDYFPSWLILRRGPDFLLERCGALHAELRGLAQLHAVRRFIEEASVLEDVPATVYTLRQDQKDMKGCVRLAVKGVEGKKSLLYDCTWNEVHRLTIRGRRFEVETGGGLGRVSRLVYYTPSACCSRLILLHIQQTHRFHLDARRTRLPHTAEPAGKFPPEEVTCDSAWLGERLRRASGSSGDSFTTFISENRAKTTPRVGSKPRDWAGSPPVIDPLLISVYLPEVEMSVDDPMERLVDGGIELLVDDPAQVQWLAGWSLGFAGVTTPSSARLAEMTMEIKQVLEKKALTELSVD